MGRRRRRRKKLLDNLREILRNWKLENQQYIKLSEEFALEVAMDLSQERLRDWLI